MSAESSGRSSLWPQIFTKRRDFCRKSENQPYIEFLQTLWFEGEEYEGEEEESDESESGSESESEGGEYNEDYAEEEDASSGLGNRDEGDTINRRNTDQDLTDDSKAKASNKPSKVRLFMKGCSGEEDDLHHRGQVEEVASICEQANVEDGVVTKTGKHRKRVALIDDRSIRSTILTDGDISPPGDCRPYLGALTAEGLGEELRKKRFRIATERNDAMDAFDDEETDAERRVVFITDLDPSTMEVLVMTASIKQASALKDLFYKHLMGKASIGVTIPPTGFTKFTLDFHIPYYVLKTAKALSIDTRRKSDGKPLRRSRELPFLSIPMNASKPTKRLYCLYEAQISVGLTGIDHWVWSAFGFVDTYFGSDDTVEGYDQMKGRDCRRLGRPDPLAAGQINAHEPIWMPREYFLKVFQVRMHQVLREWNYIADKVDEEVKQSRTRTEDPLPLSSDDPKARGQIRDSIRWNNQMVKLLRQLIGGLSDTIQVWDHFKQKDIGYFRCQNDPPNSLASSLDTIEKAFGKLGMLHTKLQTLKKELCDDAPQGLDAHLTLESNDAAIFQRKVAGNIHVITVLMALFFPLSLASSLFSTTGILPKNKTNLPSFIHATLILAFFMAVVYAFLNVASNWSACLQQIIVLLDIVRNAISSCLERPAKKQACIDVSNTQRPWQWGLPNWRSRKADAIEPADLESGG